MRDRGAMKRWKRYPESPALDERPGRQRHRTRSRRIVMTTAVIGCGLVLAACSSSGASSTTTSTGGSSRPPGSGSGGFGGRQLPGASGTIASVSGSTMEVQGSSSQTTVSFTSSTTISQRVSGSASSVVAGVCVSAFGKPTSGSSTSNNRFGQPVTASSVTVSQPTSGKCSSGFGGGAAGGGGFPGGGQAPQGTPPSSLPQGRRPSGQFGSFGAASGLVTAVNGSSVTVQESNPQTGSTSSVTVTLTGSTSYSEVQSATTSALVVGQCARAFGSSDSTGAIAAQSITVSSPSSNGCSSGNGFPGGPGGAGGAASGGANGT